MSDNSLLWDRMWGETKFVPASSSDNLPVELNTDDRIEDLERRVKSLEMRLKKLSRI